MEAFDKFKDAPYSFDKEACPNTTRLVLSEWRQKDAEAAKQYVLGIEDAVLRRQFIQDYIGGMGIGEGAAAFALSLPPGKDRDTALLRVDASWTRSDQDAALAYLRTEGDTEFVRSLSARMVFGFADDGHETAFAWANKVPESLREHAVITAIEHWQRNDALAAAAAVRAMLDGPLKTAAEQALAK